MAHTLKISDGTTNIDFLGTDYKILSGSGWTPGVATRRRSKMAGRSPYNDVVETMAISVTGTSESDCLANLATLSNLLDQCNAWGAGENVTAVYIEYEPTASALAASVKSVIWNATLELPRNFDGIIQSSGDTIGDGRNGPIRLTFTRRGLWLGATETEVSSASTGNPAILTSANFSDTAAIPWPYDAYIQFSADPVFSTGGFYAAFVDESDKILLIEGEDAGTETNMTDAADASASSGNVSRTNTGVTTAQWGDAISGVGALDAALRKVHVFAMVRNNSSTISYTLKASYHHTTHPIEANKTAVVDTSSQDPQIIDLGLIDSPVTFNASNSQLFIDITADDSITANNQLDIDYIVVVGVDESTQIVNLDSSGTDTYWNIDHRLDSHRKPLASLTSNGSTLTDAAIGRGDIVLSASGTAITCVVFGPDAGDFVVEDVSNNELNVTLSVTRTYAYLTPL